MGYDSLRINAQRVKDTLLELSKIGGTKAGGVHRLALTDEDRRARDLLLDWFREAEMDVTVDQMGNIFGRRGGENPELPPVMSGSHIDTQPKGGKFDGSYGVIGALEVARTLNDHEVETNRSFEVVSWTNEEGTRFAPPLMGSGVYVGEFTLDYAYSRVDKEGKSFGDELKRINYQGKTPCSAGDVHAYLEMHIEQGPVLESEKKTIGLVQGIFGIIWLDVNLKGQSNQAGPTPMHMRRDPLVAAADMIRAIRNIPLRVGGDLVSTVGSIDAQPNSRNTIPGEVRLTVDFRSAESERLDKALELLSLEIDRASKREDVDADVKLVWRIPYTPFSQNCIEAIEASIEMLGYNYMSMTSGAGHDAKYLADICDTGMIFVPSIGGRSHCEEEATDWKDLETGCNVLLHSILKLVST